MTDARFEAFVRTYQDMVYGTAVRLLGSRGEAEDVAQTVFLKAFQHFDQIESNPGAPGWLKTVTRNLCLNHLSRYRRRWRLFSEVERPGDEETSFAASLVAEGSAAGDIERADDRRRLEAALHRLPDHQRVPLVLFHFEQLSYDEIATTLGVSLAKVKTDLHRGREALRTLLTAGHGSL